MPRQRPQARQLPVGVKVFLARLHGKLGIVRSAINSFLANDPWALLGLIGIRNWTPIPHKPDMSRPVRYASEGYASEGYIVRDLPKARGRKVIEAQEPLGPEDFDLGATPPETHTPHDEHLNLVNLWPQP